MCVLLALACRAYNNKESFMWKTWSAAQAKICSLLLICSIFSVLFVPVFILRERCAIARATWVDEWWCPLVNIAPYMCHRPKEPMSWTSFLSFFSPSYSLLTYFPRSSPLFLLPFTTSPLSALPRSLHPFLSLPSSSCFSIHPPHGCFIIATALQRREGWDPSLFLLILHACSFFFLRLDD